MCSHYAEGLVIPNGFNFTASQRSYRLNHLAHLPNPVQANLPPHAYLPLTCLRTYLADYLPAYPLHTCLPPRLISLSTCSLTYFPTSSPGRYLR